MYDRYLEKIRCNKQTTHIKNEQKVQDTLKLKRPIFNNLTLNSFNTNTNLIKPIDRLTTSNYIITETTKTTPEPTSAIPITSYNNYMK